VTTHHLNVIALHDELERARFRRGMNWYQVAEELGVTPSLMTRVKQGLNISSDALVSILVWLGKDEPISSFILSGSGEEGECSPDGSTRTKSRP
jgi:transcriptional regulator with XRE-family HTH domain